MKKCLKKFSLDPHLYHVPREANVTEVFDEKGIATDVGKIDKVGSVSGQR